MTPTLAGRWQTRILLYLMVGLPVTLLFALYFTNWQWNPPRYELSAFQYPFIFLTVLLALGLVLDVIYIQIQRFHWDQDWPFAYQFFFSIIEYLIVYYAASEGWLDSLFTEGRPTWDGTVYHFSTVFILSFLALLGAVQIFLVRWRFKGGELGRFPVR